MNMFADNDTPSPGNDDPGFARPSKRDATFILLVFFVFVLTFVVMVYGVPVDQNGSNTAEKTEEKRKRINLCVQRNQNPARDPPADDPGSRKKSTPTPGRLTGGSTLNPSNGTRIPDEIVVTVGRVPLALA